MLKPLYRILFALILAAATWLWVQKIAIPHQIADSVERGIPRGNLSDLYPRWLGARELLLHRRNPYSADLTREIQAGYYGRAIDASRANDPKDQQAFAYPLYVVFLLAPTVGLPFAIVQHAFFVLLIAATAASIPLWFGALGSGEMGSPPSAATQILWIVLTLGCFPAIQGFKLQQLTLAVAFFLAAAMYGLVRGHLVMAGVLLALAGIKPQLVALTIVWLGIWIAGNWRERRQLLWSYVASMAVLIAGGEILLPGWIGEFRAASAAYYRYTEGGKSILDVALTPLFGRMVAALLVCVLIVVIWRLRHHGARTAEFRWLLALTMATTLMVIPMFAPYNQVLLLPALMVIVQYWTALWRRNAISRFFALLTMLAVAWPWVASLALVIALLFLPGVTVQKAWAVPLYTNFAIPLLVLALLLFMRRDVVSGSAEAPSRA